MATDADGNAYYDAGTIVEQFDNWDVYEDADGNVGFLTNDSELRLHEAGHVFGEERAVPTEDELAEGELMLFVNSGDSQLTVGVGGSGSDDSTPVTTETLTAL